MSKKILVLDTETTGLSAEKDDILQISMIDGKYDTDGKIINEIKECLSTKRGCKIVSKFLTEIIDNEVEDTNMLEEAIKLRNAVKDEMAKFQDDNEM